MYNYFISEILEKQSGKCKRKAESTIDVVQKQKQRRDEPRLSTSGESWDVSIAQL